ncbi:MAG: CpsD/CapB family tyrosine-protein kinase [Burkholderiales bacterium]|jgi:protein-tyrosine kinase
MSSNSVLTFRTRAFAPVLTGPRVSTTLQRAMASRSGYVESVRALAMQLRSRWFDGSPGRAALAISSVDPGDGRSLLTAALAVEFARSGRQTLVIDADLRMPAQQHLFNLPARRGLGHVLAGLDEHAECLPVPAVPRLSVLTAGTEPPEPQECFGGSRLVRLMDDLALSHDVILVDTPAAQLAPEAPLIAQAARGALLLARSGRTRSSDLQELARLLRQVDVQLLGTTLNDAA